MEYNIFIFFLEKNKECHKVKYFITFPLHYENELMIRKTIYWTVKLKNYFVILIRKLKGK